MIGAAVTSRRLNGRARLTITSRLRSKPCKGTVTFTVTAAGRRTRSTVSVRRSCSIRSVVRLKVRRGTRVRVRARFNGNAELKARSSRAVTRRVRSPDGRERRAGTWRPVAATRHARCARFAARLATPIAGDVPAITPPFA